MSKVPRFVHVVSLSVLVGVCVLVGCAPAGEDLWQTDFTAAKAKAKAENKLLLVDFTGSDWCGWCIRLKQEVFDQELFQSEAPKQFVLVELDFPRQKQLSAALKEQNDRLARQYKIQGYPTILVLDADGAVIARTGYQAGGPEKYMRHLVAFVKAYETVRELRAQLGKVRGLDRARLLDQLIEAYATLGNETDDIAAWNKEIVELDSENKAGLRVKYEFRCLMAEATKLEEGRKFDEAKAAFDKALALPGITGEQRQDAYFAQGECYFHKQDFASVVACLKKAQAAAPDSPKVPDIKSMIERFAGIAETQQAVAKLEAELKTAQGLDRAKVLDRLIDASAKLGLFGLGANLAEKTPQWSREIIALDADNKAGLKRKYEFQGFLAEAEQLIQSGKADQADAVLDKALALPELKAEQIQDAQFLKGNSRFARGRFQPALECLQKALAAAHESPKSSGIKDLIQRCETALATERAKQTEPAKPELK